MPAKKETTGKSTRSKRKTTAAKKTTSRKGRASAAKSTAPSIAKSKQTPGDAPITIDRRRGSNRRSEDCSKATDTGGQPPLERRAKVQRRRQIDPTTCERDYSIDEVEFMNAMDEYKRTSGRMFPTCSEVLEVIRELGYTKLSPAELALVRPEIVASTGSSTDQDDLEVEGADGEEEMAAAAAEGWEI